MYDWLAAAGVAAAMALALWTPRRRHSEEAFPRVSQPTGVEETRNARWRRSKQVQPTLAEVCIEVSSRLRAGAGVDDAWNRALSRGGQDAMPARGAAPSTWQIPDGGAEVPDRLLALAGSSPAADAAIAACRLAHVAGTPLADVLETCAAGIAEAEAAHADRRRALAGPASTAKLLGWLPVASLLLGTSLGSDPIGVALEGGLGLLSLVLGAGLLIAGRAWTRGLVRIAMRSGSSGHAS